MRITAIGMAMTIRATAIILAKLQSIKTPRFAMSNKQNNKVQEDGPPSHRRIGTCNKSAGFRLRPSAELHRRRSRTAGLFCPFS